jgi:hypothetical protein
MDSDLAWEWTRAALAKIYTGWTLEYIDSLPYDTIQVLLGIEAALVQYKKMHQKDRR